MDTIAEQDMVTLSFTGKLDNGEIFKVVSSEEPLRVTIGQAELPPTVELGIIGLQAGDRTSIRVPPEEGYGPRLKELVQEVPLSSFGNRLTPKPGMVLSRKIEKDGRQHTVPATVVAVGEEYVSIDYNHPAAGHHLTYDITILDIVKAG